MSTINVSPQRTELGVQPSPVRDASQHLQDTSITTRQIVRACVRCRKQKAKCDPFRPCSVCVKADVECISRPVTDARTEISCDVPSIRPSPAGPSDDRPAKARRISSTQSAGNASVTRSRRSVARNDRRSPSAEAQAGSPEQDGVDDSVAMVAVEESSMNTRLFTLTPGHLMENSPICPSVEEGISPAIISPRPIPGNGAVPSPAASTVIDQRDRAVLPWSYSRLSAASLLSRLPPRPVTDYLVAVYFNTVHWFMVVVHEGHFLHHYRTIMDVYAKDPNLVPNTDEDFTFALLILTVVVMGGRYASIHSARTKRCRDIYLDVNRSSHLPTPQSTDNQEFDLSKATSQLFFMVRSNCTDALACGTIATVQVLLLLGSLYLYHGESNLAWTNSGCTVRAAQALSLHKESSELRWNSPYYQRMDPAERCQLRRRLFWAVHTSDRFLAMCYGLPLLISDDDCVAGPPSEDDIYPPPGCSSFLMIEDDLQGPSLVDLASGNRRQVTLLTYQTYKIHIYIILGEIISALYRQSSDTPNAMLSKYDFPASMATTAKSGSKYENLVDTVQRLEMKLQNWYNDLPKALRLSNDMTYPPYDELNGVGDDDEDGEDGIIIPVRDDLQKDSVRVQKRRIKMRKGIYGMQALLFQLAYDNALILIHRPILALKSSLQSASSYRVFSRSVDTCWKAALRISNIGKHHIFLRSQQAHAISYVGIHLFTAGVVLSVFASSAPLSRRAWEAKQGLSRIIRMQRKLQKKVVVSSQSLSILENLAREVVKKEMTTILAQDTDATDDERQETSESRTTGDSLSNDYAATGMTWDTVNILPRRQRDADSRTDATACQSEFPADLLAGFSDGLLPDDNIFNESLLDIDRFLSDPQFLSASDLGITGNGAFPSNTSQPTGIWWFPSCDQTTPWSQSRT